MTATVHDLERRMAGWRYWVVRFLSVVTPWRWIVVHAVRPSRKGTLKYVRYIDYIKR